MSEVTEQDRKMMLVELELVTGYSPKFLESRSDEELVKFYKERVSRGEDQQ